MRNSLPATGMEGGQAGFTKGDREFFIPLIKGGVLTSRLSGIVMGGGF